MKKILPWLIAFCLIIIATILYCWQGTYDFDEVEHLHAAWMVGQGLTPFVDFFEHHHPTLWYILAPITKLFNTTHYLIFSSRLLFLGFLGLTVYFLHLTIKLVLPNAKTYIPIALLLSLYMFTANSIETRPDPVMNLFLIAGLFFWIKTIINEKYIYSVFSGASLAIAFVFLQKALVLIGLFGIAQLFVFIKNIKNNENRKFLFLSPLVFILTIGFVIAGANILFFNKVFGQSFYFWNYDFNSFLLLKADQYYNLSTIKPFIRSFIQNPILYIAAIYGIVFSLTLIKKNNTVLFITILTFIYIITTLFIGLTRAQYLLFLFLLLTFFAAFFTEKIQNSKYSFINYILVFAMITEFTAISFLMEKNFDQRNIQNITLEKTTPEDKIDVTPPYHPIFRFDSSFFWYNSPIFTSIYNELTLKNVVRNDLKKITNNLPKFVLIVAEEPDTQPYYWKEYKNKYKKNSVILNKNIDFFTLKSE